uniref:Uncharacterized protein n=1 Tax=Talaromyces marneffei PM1 TaxID=1077442 RepID=A0A093US19_TALMA
MKLTIVALTGLIALVASQDPTPTPQQLCANKCDPSDTRPPIAQLPVLREMVPPKKPRIRWCCICYGHRCQSYWHWNR